MTTGHSTARWIRKLMPAAAAGLMGAVLGQAPIAAQPAPTAAPASGTPAAKAEVSDFVVPTDVPLGRPLETPAGPSPAAVGIDPYGPTRPFVVPNGVPLGFSGRTSILPSVFQTDGHFVPVEDRWRLGFPEWDRYDKGHPITDDYPYDEGNICNPFKQNVLKGDYPIIGQNTFLILTFTNVDLIEPRQIPTATTPFESTANPGQTEFFGKPNQLVNVEVFSATIDLFHGDGAFKPNDWSLVVTPTFAISNLSVSELAVVNPNVLKGVQRERSFFTLQEYFVEKKIADLSPDFDFVSVRVGSQPLNADFRGFIFNDINRAVRVFGTLESNRDQFNIAIFNQAEKDTNTQLNSLVDNRNQQVFIANFYRQDFIFPGLTSENVFIANHDSPSFKFDKNGVLVRPDPAGVFQEHSVDAYYLGWNLDGHINRFNIDTALYWVLGYDSMNPIANTGQYINAQMAAAELSYDRDYVRFRTSFFFASGDSNPNNHHATGFDSILDSPNFAGTEFSYWQRQAIPLFGVNLKQRLSLVPDLRSSKIQGQSNFVNPGLELFNLGFDVDLTPKIKWINNFNWLWFDKTAAIETFIFQGNIDRYIGSDLSTGIQYRPLLSNNIIMEFGFATLIPGQGFREIYDKFNHPVDALVAGFAQLVLNY
jgi:hypothetical protein